MAGIVLLAANPGMIVGGEGAPQLDQAVGADFERFDGLGRLDHPPAEAGAGPHLYEVESDYPRPGQLNQPTGQVYTPGPVSGVVGTFDGQPLPTSDRIHREPGGYTPSKTPSVQMRLGVGQYGPSSLGADQTTFLSEISNNPPVPGDLTSIIAGLA